MAKITSISGKYRDNLGWRSLMICYRYLIKVGDIVITQLKDKTRQLTSLDAFAANEDDGRRMGGKLTSNCIFMPQNLDRGDIHPPPTHQSGETHPLKSVSAGNGS
jgi:hypothetical protein